MQYKECQAFIPSFEARLLNASHNISTVPIGSDSVPMPNAGHRVIGRTPPRYSLESDEIEPVDAKAVT